MEKVFVIKADKGSWDDFQTIILDIYKNKESANHRVIELQKEAEVLRNKYTSEEVEELSLQSDEWDYWHPSGGFMPDDIKEFNKWAYHTDFYSNIRIEEYDLK